MALRTPLNHNYQNPHAADQFNTIMKTQLFTLFLGILSLPLFASDEYEKTYSKNFEVRPNVKLETRSSFGSIDIMPWDKNEVQVDIEIIVEARSESAAEDIFEDIEVVLDGDLYRVKVSTERNGNWSSKNGNKVEINIHIKAPENAELNVDHDFGSSRIGAFGNKAEIQNAFGELEIEQLRHDDCHVTSEYGNARIRHFNGGELDVQFGSLRVDRLTGNTEINSSYSDTEINGIEASVESLEVDNEFGSVDVNLHPEASFAIVGEASFGDVELPREAVNIKKDKDMMSYDIRGDVGSGKKGELIIHSSFGDVDVDVD